MPNWCDFNAVIHGDKKEIDVFYKRLIAAREQGNAIKKWGTYCLLLQHGYTDAEALAMPEYVGGSLDQIDEPVFNGIDWHIYIYMTTRWSPMIAGFDKLLIKDYLTLKGVYYAEEPGCEIYVNTDTEHKFFTVKYCIYDDDDGSEYFDSDEEFIKYMKDTYKKDIPLISDLRNDDDIKVKRGKFVRFHRFVIH